MNNTKLIAIIATLTLMIGIFAVIPAFSVQPPLDASTYYVGTIGQPVRVDPARAYDTASGELLQNIYETLIWWTDKHPVSFTPGVGYNLTVDDYSDLDAYGPVLCTEVPTVANGRLVVNASGSYWRFTINTAATYHPWVDGTGATQPSRAITAADVVYSFRRQVIFDSYYSPVWMWMQPAFGFQFWSSDFGGPYDSYGNGTIISAADEAAAATSIQNWCYNIGNDVYFYFKLPWAEGVLKQIFSQTWGGVVQPDFVKEMGGWDGSFAAGWSNYYLWKPTANRGELDSYKDPAVYGAAHASKYASFVRRIVGTGPYTFTSWDTVNKIVRFDYFPTYWRGFGQAGDKAGNYFQTVLIKGIDSYPTRKMLFLEGEFDVAAIPRPNMYDLLVSTYNPIAGVNLVYNVAALSNDVMLFNMNISSASSYQAYVGYPSHKTGAQAYFFNNTHLRRAFSWAFNYTSYFHDALFDEAILQRSWWVDGLSPASYKNTNTSMPQRNLDLTEMQNELNLAVIDGFNVGTEGFEITLVYNIGNDARLIAANLITLAFQSLGSKYKVNIVGLDWPVMLDAENSGYLPMYDIGWLADFADPDNFCEPYQKSTGTFLVTQGPPFPEDQTFVDDEIDNAMIEPDFTTRGNMYKDLQYRYWLDSASFTLYQPVGRRFARDWVQGWYYNALYPGLYAYDLYKSIVSNPGVDVDATSTITPGPGPTYTKALIFGSATGGGMYLGYTGGTAHLQELMGMNYTVHVVYASGGVANLVVALGLKRNSTLETQYPVADQTVLSVGQGYTTVFWWSENGSGGQVVLADNAQQGTTHTGTIYSVGLEAYPVNGAETDALNNYATVGVWNASRLVGDIKSDGIVDIFDALKLSGAFATKSGDKLWNVFADLKPDGVIDIFDAILLSSNFNQHVP